MDKEKIESFYYNIGLFSEGELSEIAEALKDSIEFQSDPRNKLLLEILKDRLLWSLEHE